MGVLILRWLFIINSFSLFFIRNYFYNKILKHKTYLHPSPTLIFKPYADYFILVCRYKPARAGPYRSYGVTIYSSGRLTIFFTFFLGCRLAPPPISIDDYLSILWWYHVTHYIPFRHSKYSKSIEDILKKEKKRTPSPNFMLLINQPAYPLATCSSNRRL